MQKKFNQKEYIKQYRKDHYKQFKVELKKQDFEELNKLLKKHKLSKPQFILKAKEILEKK